MPLGVHVLALDVKLSDKRRQTTALPILGYGWVLWAGLPVNSGAAKLLLGSLHSAGLTVVEVLQNLWPR